ncbi:MAG: 50S ribosomal protein L4 [Candidatus Diapherotrites archaeon]|nr:50S ribosomal protein L4 [Candidatus Diapherotrites archaeon]
MKVSVFGLDGKAGKSIELPKVFDSIVDANLIKRAVLSSQSKAKQPMGKYRRAGLDNTAVYIGYRGLPGGQKSINTGKARLPRMKNRRQLMSGKVAGVSQAVGGHAAHPPKLEKVLAEEMNKKERRKALASAIAATGKKELVFSRAKTVESFPVVIENGFEKLAKTKEVVKVLQALKLLVEVTLAKEKRSARAGKTARRTGHDKKRKSLLIVVGKKSAVQKGARNLEGVDVVEARNLSVELLAPGANPGRLTVYTEDSLVEIAKLQGRS